MIDCLLHGRPRPTDKHWVQTLVAAGDGPLVRCEGVYLVLTTDLHT